MNNITKWLTQASEEELNNFMRSVECDVCPISCSEIDCAQYDRCGWYVLRDWGLAGNPKRESSGAVDHPAHYNTGEIEVIDAIDDWKLGFELGNAVKYIARADHKGKPVEDLQKARWYLDREIEKRSAQVEGDE